MTAWAATRAWMAGGTEPSGGTVGLRSRRPASEPPGSAARGQSAADSGESMACPDRSATSLATVTAPSHGVRVTEPNTRRQIYFARTCVHKQPTRNRPAALPSHASHIQGISHCSWIP